MTDTPWFGSVPPPVEKLARRLAAHHGIPVDDLCIPNEPYVLSTPSGPCCPVPAQAIRPLWTFYIHIAQYALEAKNEQAVEDVLVMPEGFVDTQTPDEKWRTETGLEGERE